MFLHSLATGLFVIVCVLLISVILLQKGKGGAGLFGSMANTQMKFFGGSGGQDLFQKMTWAMGAFVMTLSLVLAVFNAGALSYGQYAAPVAAQTASLAEQM